MDAAFLNINETSAYLNLKCSYLYSLVEGGEIPYYRVGRLIRFKQSDIEAWMENHRQNPSGANKRARAILKSTNKGSLDIDAIVKKCIDDTKEKCYSPCSGRPDRVGGLGKEVEDGAL